jgi:hydroxymethylglutaryl-CoA lyase
MVQYPNRVIIEEQGLRDGIQNEKRILPTQRKLELIDELILAGVKYIQVASFVHPKAVPQMADADELCTGLKNVDGVSYSGLALNTRGVERAAKAGLEYLAVSLSASDAHSRKNANKSLEDARKDYADMARAAKENGLKIRGGVQCAFGCRFQGRVEPELVLEIVQEQLELGVDDIALADSTGMANPVAIQSLGSRAVELAGERPVWLHLHDTEGKGLANALAALQAGINHFDTAFGGMGGCPFIKGATGNIATEDFAAMLHQMGIETGINVRRIAEISRSLEAFFDKPSAGKMHRLLARDDIELSLV